MTMARLHKLLVLAGVAVVPLAAFLTLVSLTAPMLNNAEAYGGIAVGFGVPLSNYLYAATVLLGAVNTAALCFWAAENIAPERFPRFGWVSRSLTLAIYGSAAAVALALVEFTYNASFISATTLGFFVSSLAHALWGISSVLLFLPVLLFARAQAKMRRSRLTLDGAHVSETFT